MHPSDKAQTIVQQAMARARSTLAEARQVIDDLRHAQVDLPDLGEAIRAEVERFTTATGIPCALNLALPAILPDLVQDYIRRVVAEGLMNVARHARASQVWVEVVSDDSQMKIQISDNGIGFEIGDGGARTGHYGLLGMRERARLAGGTLEISSAPGQGTTLYLCLPLSQEVNNQSGQGLWRLPSG